MDDLTRVRRFSTAVLVAFALSGCSQARPLTNPLVVNGPEAGAGQGGGAEPAPPTSADPDPSASPGVSPPSPVADPMRPSYPNGCRGVAAPSCVGLAPTCGPSHDEDCCASCLISGGAFNRSNDARYPATVSGFRLDRFEVTVGRFRKFLAAYQPGMTPVGAGKNPHDASDVGWQAAWEKRMPEDAAAAKRGFDEQNPWQLAWTPEPGANEDLPLNDIFWFEAYAFCIWDGGRLPSEAEWNYAAAGGAEQRVYPWSGQPGNMEVDGRVSVPSAPGGDGRLPPVGASSPEGDGRWSQADLSGSVREWTADSFLDVYPTPCVDCSFRDGGYSWAIRPSQGVDYLTSSRDAYSGVPYMVGVRCARNVP